MSPTSSTPYSSQQEQLATSLLQLAPQPSRVTVSLQQEEVTVTLPQEDLLSYMRLLRDHTPLQYKVLVDITAVDYPQRASRFSVVYHLLSLRYGERLRIKVLVDETSSLPSLMHLFSSAAWYEREVWDLFGIWFHGHSDLRRILTDYGFRGHPLRKDFPLTGYNEVRYDEASKRVVREPLSLTQEMRSFKVQTPWLTFQPRDPQHIT